MQFLHLYLKWETMRISGIPAIPIIITCLLHGTLCDTEIPRTFYGEKFAVHCTIVANSSDPVTEDLRSAWFLGPGKNRVTNLSVKLKGHKYFIHFANKLDLHKYAPTKWMSLSLLIPCILCILMQRVTINSILYEWMSLYIMKKSFEGY